MAWLASAVFALHLGLAVYAIGSILLQRREPLAMVAWILTILAMPIVGTFAYLLFGETRVQRRAGKRRRRLLARMARVRGIVDQRTSDQLAWAARAAARAEAAESCPDPDAPANRDAGPRSGLSAAGHEGHQEQRLPADLETIEQLARRVVGMPATTGNAVQVYEKAEETYAVLESAIRNARQHIHLLYYIWQPDETGRHFRDLLCERARAGVRVRLLLDSVGSLSIRSNFLRPLHEAGGQSAFFLPLYPLRKRWTPHLRNHRKIAVMDGTTAFTGSQNIGDEYRGRLARLSPWYDCHMRVEGPAALHLQQAFAEDWFFATGEEIDVEACFPPAPVAGQSIVQILPTGPDQNVSALQQVVFAAVASARAMVRIATPYFVPDQGLQMALLHAAYRGVRVQLVLPTRTDAPFVLWAGRSFYAELLEAGVEIYEFYGGVLHSKIVTVDDRWCMVGSANMDFRSFRLNFEITALVYDPAVARQLATMVDGHSHETRRVTLGDLEGRTLRTRLVEGFARLFAPLL